MPLNRDSLETTLKARGVSPLEGDMAALLADLTALELRLAQFQRLRLRDMEPAFLVRAPVPGKGRKP